MKKAAGILYFLLTYIISLGQSETNNFSTRDTVFNMPASQKVVLRVTAPTFYLTAGNPDTASRPMIVFLTGAGEGNAAYDSNQLKANIAVYGPHYWLNNGWDGRVELGNGRHYPIIVSINWNRSLSGRPWQLLPAVKWLKQRYHPKNIHVTGLSAG